MAGPVASSPMSDDLPDPINPWAPPGAGGAVPPPPPTTPPAPPAAPAGYPTAPPSFPPTAPAAPPAYPADAPLAPPAPPSPPPRSRTPWLVALGALVVVVLVTGVVFLTTRDDDDDTDDAGSAERTAAVLHEVSVDGPPLPTATIEGFDPTTDAAVGQRIPTITGTGVDGEPITIGPGRPQIIVVMAHWCPHCQAEIPRIVDWDDDGRVPSGVDIVGVSTAVDESRGNFPPSAWLEREDWEFPTLADDDEITAMTALGASAFPTLIAVTADGTVAGRFEGEASRDEFDALVDLAQGATPEPRTLPVDTTPSTVTDAVEPACPPTDGATPRVTAFTGPPPMCIDTAATYRAILDTSAGSFVVELDAAQAPGTVNNFVFLARYHFYDDVVFHRVISGFVIQGGDPEGTGMGGPGYEFPDETPARGYERYDLAMANAGPDTNGSQFFVITGEQGEDLPPSYSLFGRVVEGTDVVDAIGETSTDEADRPLTPVVIRNIEIVEV